MERFSAIESSKTAKNVHLFQTFHTRSRSLSEPDSGAFGTG
jgi:hypothetical protein